MGTPHSLYNSVLSSGISCVPIWAIGKCFVIRVGGKYRCHFLAESTGASITTKYGFRSNLERCYYDT